MRMTAAELLNSRSERRLWSVAPTESVFAALALMSKQDLGALLVLDRGRLVGIFSERDYARKVILLQRASKETKVSEIMTRSVITVAPNTTIDRCMRLMNEGKIRHLPVVSEGIVLGMLSIRDVVRGVISSQEFTIDQLTQYITDSRDPVLPSLFEGVEN